MLAFNKESLPAQLSAAARLALGEEAEILKCLGGGSFGRAYLAQTPSHGRIVLKAYRVESMNEDEAFQLKLLGANTGVPMPKVLFTYSDEDCAVLGMSYIPGKNAAMPGFIFKTKAERQRFAAAVVEGMLPWHAVKGEKYGDLRKPKYTKWREYYRREIVDPVLEGIAGLVNKKRFSPKQYATLLRATERFDELVDEPEQPVLVHGDLNIMNIMAQPSGFVLTGFIDPFNSLWADRDYDLFQLQNMWGNRFGLYKEYIARLGISAEEQRHIDRKTAYYAAVNEALAYLRSGVKFEAWHMLWDYRLRKVCGQRHAGS
jgi:aminoglycoside phosphotransferase